MQTARILITFPYSPC